MSIEDVLQDIQSGDSKYAFLANERTKLADAFYPFLEKLYETDWIFSSKTIDKREIFSTLQSVSRACGRQSFRAYSPSRALPVWETFIKVDYNVSNHSMAPGVWNPKEFGVRGFEEISRRVTHALIQECVLPKLRHMPVAQRERVLPNLDAYVSSVVRYYVLRCFGDFELTSSSHDLLLLEPLLEFAFCGQGMIFLAGSEPPRVEIRLPVWDEKDYPVDILEEDVYRYPEHISMDVPLLKVAVIKNGVFVPELVWRTPERITAKDIFVKESNLEVRRIMMEMMKNETFLRQARARVIDERDGLKLFSVWVTERVHFNLVQCVCPSTLRVYYLRVPPEITDANTAIAWTFGETGTTYQPEAET